MTKSTTKKHPGGRPTKFDPAYCEQARKLCLLGFTDKRLADFFGVEEKTLNTWKKKFPKFLQSLKDGKDVADAQIALSLYQRALGYRHPETKFFVVADGMGLGSSIEEREVMKIYPPDTAAAKIWLSARQPEIWRERTEQDITSKGESITKPMTDEQFKTIVKLLNDPDSDKGH